MFTFLRMCHETVANFIRRINDQVLWLFFNGLVFNPDVNTHFPN